MNELPKDFAGLPSDQPERIGLSPEHLDRLTAVMEREIAAGKAPGVSMLIARRGRIGYLKTLGALKTEGPSMPLDALFRIYSMTKPLTSFAAMMLVEQGRLLLNDPVDKYIPSFAQMKVGVERGDDLELVDAKRPITVQDLLRHTSGLTYGFTGGSAVQKLAQDLRLLNDDRSNAGLADALAELPLMHQPGEAWEYSHSTDVVGRIVEVIEGASLGEVFRNRICAPLGMDDTAFYAPPQKVSRRAEALDWSALERAGIGVANATQPPRLELGGGGLISSLGDYARFLTMLQGGGALDGKRLIAPATLAFMTSNHLAANVKSEHVMLMSGYGFGLGFAVRLALGAGADGRKRRRIQLGRRRRHGVFRLAARRNVCALHGAGAGISRLFPDAVPQSGLCGAGVIVLRAVHAQGHDLHAFWTPRALVLSLSKDAAACAIACRSWPAIACLR